jgi:hypothetical protein
VVWCFADPDADMSHELLDRMGEVMSHAELHKLSEIVLSAYFRKWFDDIPSRHAEINNGKIEIEMYSDDLDDGVAFEWSGSYNLIRNEDFVCDLPFSDDGYEARLDMIR